MKPAPFRYLRARSGQEAVLLLHEHGDLARVIAGGQSLVPMMNFRVARPEVLIDLNGCSDLNYIKVVNGTLCIGAMTRQRVAECNDLVLAHCPVIASALRFAGPVSVRNRGTVGGVLANCYPTADLLAVMLCVDAQCVILGRGGVKVVPASEFIVDAFTSALESNELLVEVRIALPPRHGYSVYCKVSDYPGGAATVGVALHGVLTPGLHPAFVSARIAAVGLGNTVLRLPTLESGLVTEQLQCDFWAALNADVDVLEEEGNESDPASYRRHVACTLLERAAEELVALSGGRLP